MQIIYTFLLLFDKKTTFMYWRQKHEKNATTLCLFQLMNLYQTKSDGIKHFEQLCGVSKMNNDKLEKSAKALLSLPSVPQNKKRG